MDEHENGDEQFPDHSEYAPYASGSTLSQLNGRNVRVLGRVSGGAGQTLSLRTTDDAELTVSLRTPLSSRPTGWVEVVGKLQGRTLNAHELVVFPEAVCEQLDDKSHTALTQLLATLEDPWNLGESKNGY